MNFEDEISALEHGLELIPSLKRDLWYESEEGIITREKALELVDEENQPRSESIRWYCDTIKVDIEEAVKIINKIPKKYSENLSRSWRR